MTDEKKEIFGLTLGDAPALTDYAFNGQTPATTPVLRRVTWQTIKNMFFASIAGYTAIAQSDGWTPATGTWTYASATTITVPAGGAAIYQVGDKIRFKQGAGYKYFYIITVADTLLTVTGGADYTVATPTAITDNYYSHAASPLGFPDYFNYTPTGPTNTTLTGRFGISGRTLFGEMKGVITNTPAFTNMPTLPVAVSASAMASLHAGMYLDSTTALRYGKIWAFLAAGATVAALENGELAGDMVQVNATAPITWAANDYWSLSFRYEI